MAKAKAVDGGRTKATEAVYARIYEALNKGAKYKIAAAYGGIAESTFHEWRNSRPDFSELVERAEAEAALRWLDHIEKAAENPQQWTAAAWKLERRFPEDYARREKQDVNMDLNVRVVIEHRERPQLLESIPGVVIESQ